MNLLKEEIKIIVPQPWNLKKIWKWKTFWKCKA